MCDWWTLCGYVDNDNALTIWTAVMAVFTGVAAVVVIASAVTAVRALKTQTAQHREVSRPVIVAELHPNAFTHDVAELRVSNYGNSLARNLRVSITFHDPPGGVRGLDDARTIIAERYAGTIPLLAPRRALSNTYFVLNHQAADGGNRYDLPDRLTVKVTYKSDASDHQFEDEFELDMAGLKGETRSGWNAGTNSDAKTTWRAIQSIAEVLDHRP
jgi:hypothetical protein